MKKTLVGLFLFSMLLMVKTPKVMACSCMVSPPPQEALTQSSAVFAGKVTDVEIPGGTQIGSADPVKVTFEVSRVWKGPEQKTVTLTTARDSAACGYNFEKNDEYVVYATQEEGALTTNLCSRTALLANAQEDLRTLGQGKAPAGSGATPAPDPTPEDATAAFNWTPLLSIGGLVVLVILVIALASSRKK